MAGDHDSYFRLRLPADLKERLAASCLAGGVGKVSQSDAVRVLVELRCSFTEATNRQPHSLCELCEWYVAGGRKSDRSTQPAHVFTDPRGCIVSINQEFTELCGYRLPELRGKKPGKVLQGPATERPVVNAFRKAIRSRQPFTGELTNYHKDGSPYRVRIEMRPIFDGARLTGFEADETKIPD